MPVNKYAAIRHKVIDKLIGNKYKPYPSKEDLRCACEEALYGSIDGNYISDSTIEKDLKYMKMEYDAPVKFSRKYDGYYYDDPDYSIDLNTAQIEAIKMAANILGQFKGTEVFKDFDSAIDKILDRVNISPSMNDAAIDKYVQFEKAPLVLGTEYLGPILQAIKERYSIRFVYEKFKDGVEKERQLDPYVLKEYRNRWYVTGFDKDKNTVVTYALDRINSFRPTAHSFQPVSGFDAEKYFENSVGITTSDKPPVEVLLQVNPTEGKYLKSQPLHASQEIVEDTDEKCIIRLNVIITYELITHILSLGEGGKVLAPLELVEKVKDILTNSLTKYT